MGTDFRWHAARRRLLQHKCAGWVYRLWFVLSRWKCCSCGKTFPHYPPGVLPHKRYLVTETILPLCERYVQDGEATYRTTVKERGLPIVHAGIIVASAESSEATKEAEKAAPELRLSTVWQWIGSLAGLWEKLKPRWERRQIEGDRADLSAWQVSARKHRSERRLQELVDCGRVLDVLRNVTDFETLGLSP
jgi:hypothetical protein